MKSMAKRGRKSAAELVMTDQLVVDVTRGMPSPAPTELTDAQATVWRDAVASMPSRWLQRGAHPILVAYCRHTCRARWLDQQVQRFRTEWLKVEGGLERLDRLLRMAERETKAAIACARALRLTPQSVLHRKTAGAMA